MRTVITAILVAASSSAYAAGKSDPLTVLLCVKPDATSTRLVCEPKMPCECPEGTVALPTPRLNPARPQNATPG